ncbi:hypothetical protein CEXT_370951, partial [Caerostris extrusa]
SWKLKFKLNRNLKINQICLCLVLKPDLGCSRTVLN